jgi:ferredoxin--NADP+ reductase
VLGLQVAGKPAAVARTRLVARAAATQTIKRADVPLKLEEGPMPLNTFNNKAPFKAKIVSVERIVGPKATGETCNIVIQTDGKIPFWEGQSYGVIPPVSGAVGFLGLTGIMSAGS